MSVTIRKAQIEDAAQLANIHARSWESTYVDMIPKEAIAETSARRPALWNRILSEVGGNFKFAICDTDNIIGLLVLGESRDKDTSIKTLEVISLYLLPDYFGKGFGKSAMDFAVTFAKENGYKKMSLWVFEENKRARNFYEKYGYVLDGTKKEVIIGKPMISLRYSLCV